MDKDSDMAIWQSKQKFIISKGKWEYVGKTMNMSDIKQIKVKT